MVLFHLEQCEQGNSLNVELFDIQCDILVNAFTFRIAFFGKFVTLYNSCYVHLVMEMLKIVTSGCPGTCCVGLFF